MNEFYGDDKRIGGPLGKQLSYRYKSDDPDADTEEEVIVKLPDFKPIMNNDKKNILGLFSLKDVQLD